MNDPAPVLIFGEVLFDCFPTGEQVLGGAPFNVAWHLQALGNLSVLMTPGRSLIYEGILANILPPTLDFSPWSLKVR